MVVKLFPRIIKCYERCCYRDGRILVPGRALSCNRDCNRDDRRDGQGDGCILVPGGALACNRECNRDGRRGGHRDDHTLVPWRALVRFLGQLNFLLQALDFFLHSDQLNSPVQLCAEAAAW